MKTIPKSVRHTFTVEEKSELMDRLLNALDTHVTTEAEFDAVKSSFKAKLAECESSVNTLRSLLRAGFEMRVQDCVVIYSREDGMKAFYLLDEYQAWTKGGLSAMNEAPKPVATEKMTEEDHQQELIEAESAFDDKDSIELFKPAGKDSGMLIIGRKDGFWYTALRITVGNAALSERLDTEQQAYKNRHDAIATAAKRGLKWLKENVGDAWKGFEAAVKAATAEKNEPEA